MREEEQPEEAPEITPQVLHLRDLLKWVRQGRVRVPNFQRDFTWDRPRMLSLFDSIRRQYPIGTLLFWESTKARPVSDKLGPLLLPTAGGHLLVLDGQQRLTTLAGVLLLEEMEHSAGDDSDPGRWRIYYDAKDDQFIHYDDDVIPLSAVRVASLMGTRGLYSAAQRIMEAGRGVEREIDLGPDEATRIRWIENIETVSAALAAYRIPLVVFASESLRLAVDSFARLNRSGQKIGPDELFSALTYSAEEGQETFRLASHIDSILSSIGQTGFGRVDRVVVLRCVLLAADLDPFSTKWDQLAESTKKGVAERLPAAIEEAHRGLLAAVDFLRAEGVWNFRLLPYGVHLVGLAAFFGRSQVAPTEAQRALLRRWFWVSAFTEGFGGSNPSRILVQLKVLRDVIPKLELPLRIEGIDLDSPAHSFPERHDHRSARVRALLCVMLQEPVHGPDGQMIEPQRMAADVLERGPEALVRVCVRVPSTGDGRPLQPSPANRLFVLAPQRRGQAKAWLLSVPDDVRDDVLRSHHISDAAWRSLQAGDHQSFVLERIKTLMALERQFMEKKGVVPPKSDTPERSAIDVEDEVPLSDDVDLELPEHS